MRRARILSTGMYVPPKVVSNHDLSTMFNTSDEWIVQRTGIQTRHYAEDGQGASDLGYEAACQALDAAGVKAHELDLILFATLSPDVTFPGSSCLLQKRLGAQGVATLDLRNQCTGFVYGLSVAEQFIATGKYQRILLVGAEVHSSGLDFSDQGRDVTVLFGDGAGAVVLGPSDDVSRGILSFDLHADGTEWESLCLMAPESRRQPRLTLEMISAGLHYPKMNGKHVFKHAVECLPETIERSLKEAGYGLGDVDLLIPHQANLRINELVARRLGISDQKVFHNIQRYGNTTAASIPIALHEALAQSKLQAGDLLVLAAFGSGFTWGSVVIRW